MNKDEADKSSEGDAQWVTDSVVVNTVTPNGISSCFVSVKEGIKRVETNTIEGLRPSGAMCTI